MVGRIRYQTKALEGDSAEQIWTFAPEYHGRSTLNAFIPETRFSQAIDVSASICKRERLPLRWG